MTHRSADRPAAGQATPEELSDELLAVRCLLGEPEAFDDLVARWHEPISRYVTSVLEAEHAADVVQNIWLRVLRAFPSLRDPARLRPWLFGIARRALMDRLRRQYASAAEVSLDETEGATVEAAEGATDGALERLHDTLSAMPIIEREVLVLFYLQELSLAQLADVLALPVGTVKSRLHRARRMLRDRLIAQGVEP